MLDLENSLLGKKADYKSQYDDSLLFKIPRSLKRAELGLNQMVALFYGVDIWNAYEVSWLNNNGKPLVCIATLYIPADSEFIIESKSLKLYFNSFNNTRFSSINEVANIIQNDLNLVLGCIVKVALTEVSSAKETIDAMPGDNIDHLDVSCSEYDTVNPALLECEEIVVADEINTNLLKSNCLITNQPDWGSVTVKYLGKKLRRESFLKYIVSFRNHNEFHEQCVERIFCDIKKLIKPEYLSVYARYTRRGGIDICPYRTTHKDFTMPENMRLVRQ